MTAQPSAKSSLKHPHQKHRKIRMQHKTPIHSRIREIATALAATLISSYASATLVKLEFTSSVSELYIAKPVGESYEFERDLLDIKVGGKTIKIGDGILGQIVYDTDASETNYSIGLGDPTYAAYYAVRSFKLSIGEVNLVSPDSSDYLAIYDDGLYSKVDSFYSSADYRDNENFNIFRISLFANQNLWSGLSIPTKMDLNSFYYKKISGAFLPNINDLHLNWSGNITTLHTSAVPEPSSLFLCAAGGLILLACFRLSRKP